MEEGARRPANKTRRAKAAIKVEEGEEMAKPTAKRPRKARASSPIRRRTWSRTRPSTLPTSSATSTPLSSVPSPAHSQHSSDPMDDIPLILRRRLKGEDIPLILRRRLKGT